MPAAPVAPLPLAGTSEVIAKPDVGSTPVVAASSSLKPPNSRTPQERHRLGKVAHVAIELSTQIGDSGLGCAIKQLYDQSLSNNQIADLIDAVLAQVAMREQLSEFRTYFNNAEDSKSVEPSPGMLPGRSIRASKI